MGGIILFIILDLIFLICSIILLRGKGGWMIAGYNTSSKEEQEKYDEVKLCKSMGVCIGIVTLMMIGLTVLCGFVEAGAIKEESMGPVAIIFSALVVVDIAIEIYYSNTKCKKKR